MTGRRQTSSGAFFGLLVVGAIGLLIAFISGHPGALIFGALAFGLWFLYKLVRPKKSSVPTARVSIGQTDHFRSGFKIPGLSTDNARYWFGPGHKVEVQGRAIGDLIYVGSGLKAIASDEIEPALIDPKVPVARGVRACRDRLLTYWPSYSNASPEARASYLHWLETGRADPEADIGYVFLYLYGLERRALHDTRINREITGEIADIEREVGRLLTIYQGQGSFRGYASHFLDFLNAQRLPDQSYRAAPRANLLKELSCSDRLALAQCARDGVPLPPEWAEHWLTRTTALGTAARRCPNEFSQIFRQLYQERFGDGMKLPRNRTHLVLQYRPASASFRGTSDGLLCTSELSDVSVLTAPVRRLAEIGAEASGRLGRFSRAVAKNPSAAQTFEALVELPVSAWPEGYRRQLEFVRNTVARAGTPAVIPFEKFRSWVPDFEQLTRSKLKALATAFAGFGLGMEPDLRFGGNVPAPTSRVVVFADDPHSAREEASARYLAAALTLQLATAVATAGGEAGKPARELVIRRMHEWPALSESERRRLQALIRLLFIEPPKLVGLRKKVEALSVSARQAVGDFLIQVAQVDNEITPQEIRTLQKTFQLLGLDPERVFSKIHAAATQILPSLSAPESRSEGYAIPPQPRVGQPIDRPVLSPPPIGVSLDPGRVAALQRDTERVAVLLSSIFESSQLEDQETSTNVEDPADEAMIEVSLLGLDARHTSLLKVLMTRAEWTSTEVQELAEDRELMLEGALERLSDATFDAMNTPLFDDMNPVRLNPQTVEGILGVEHSKS